MTPSTRRLPLRALRSFEAAARHLSFKQAAEELCVSPTTISNQIRQLEKDWNRKLFHRHTRAVSLTEEGRSLASVLGAAFADIRAEVDRHVTATRRRVTLAVGPIFGTRWMGPRLARFASEHPDIELVVHHGARIAEASQMDTDLAVDWGTGNWRSLDAQRLFTTRYSPVISPELAVKAGGVTAPSHLAGFTIIHQHDRSEWRNWFALAGCRGIQLNSEVTIVDSNMVERAVEEGQGVALGVFPFAQREVDSGRLIKPFDIDLRPTRAFFLLARHEARKAKAVATVWDWIVAEAAKAPGS